MTSWVRRIGDISLKGRDCGAKSQISSAAANLKILRQTMWALTLERNH